MSHPVVNAFFYGRALAEVLRERVSDGITQLLGEVGKASAEQQTWFREFQEEVQQRAQQEAQRSHTTITVEATPVTQDDLQEILDELRAEIAQLRVALQQYRPS